MLMSLLLCHVGFVSFIFKHNFLSSLLERRKRASVKRTFEKRDVSSRTAVGTGRNQWDAMVCVCVCALCASARGLALIRIPQPTHSPCDARSRRAPRSQEEIRTKNLHMSPTHKRASKRARVIVCRTLNHYFPIWISIGGVLLAVIYGRLRKREGVLVHVLLETHFCCL